MITTVTCMRLPATHGRGPVARLRRPRLEPLPRLRLPRSAPGQLCQPRSAVAPGGNLVSALIALETSRDRERLPELLGSLIGLLREQGDEELTQAFRSWVEQVLLPRRFRGGESESLPRLEEVRTMLAEQVREWTEEWVEEGREQGREQGIAQGREQGIAQGAPKNGRCCAGRRSGSSTQPQRGGWPPRWRMLPTRAGWRRLATGSSSAGRRPSCSPAYRMSVDAAYEVNRAQARRTAFR